MEKIELTSEERKRRMTYWAGYRRALTSFAVWRDGVEYVGNRPLKNILESFTDDDPIPTLDEDLIEKERGQ